MNRRGFMSALVGAAVLDPERLLWVTGKKLISIPKPKPAALLMRAGDRLSLKLTASKALELSKCFVVLEMAGSEQVINVVTTNTYLGAPSYVVSKPCTVIDYWVTYGLPPSAVLAPSLIIQQAVRT